MRKFSSAVAAALATTILAACSAEAEVPQPQAGTQAEYSMSQDKYAEITQMVEESVTAAGEAKDATLLSDRVGEPLRSQLTAQYKLASVAPSFTPADVTVSPDATPLLSGSAFPRTLMAIDFAATTSSVGTLQVWNQSNARDNYQLRAAVEVFPSPPAIDLTSTLNNEPGFAGLAADSFAVDPSAVVTDYATYLTDREMTGIQFNESDPLATQVAEQVDSLNESLGDIGEVEATFSAADSGTYGVSTTDGGAVLVGEIRYDMTITGNPDEGTARLGSFIGALYEGEADGVVEIDKPVTASYSTSVAFYIPSAQGEAQVHVLGASRPTLLSVTKEGDE